MATKSRKRRCKAIARSGKPCRAAATAGGLCFFHANPNKASELGRVGGRRKRPAVENLDPLPALNTARGVQETVARLVEDVYAGKIDPKIAFGLAPLLNLQMQVIKTTDTERRLAELEKMLANGSGESHLAISAEE